MVSWICITIFFFFFVRQIACLYKFIAITFISPTVPPRGFKFDFKYLKLFGELIAYTGLGPGKLYWPFNFALLAIAHMDENFKMHVTIKILTCPISIIIMAHESVVRL